jgi:hypothetical protein
MGINGGQQCAEEAKVHDKTVAPELLIKNKRHTHSQLSERIHSDR